MNYIRYFWIFVEIYSLQCNEQINLNNSIIVRYRLSLMNSGKHYSPHPTLQVHRLIISALCCCVCCFKVLLERGSLTLFEVGNLLFYDFVHIFVDFYNLYLAIIHTFARGFDRPGEKEFLWNRTKDPAPVLPGDGKK